MAFHGGCSLEEVVVPLAWIEQDGLYADEPAWWFGGGTLTELVAEARPVAPPIITPANELATAKPRSLWQCTDQTALSLLGIRSLNWRMN